MEVILSAHAVFEAKGRDIDEDENDVQVIYDPETDILSIAYRKTKISERILNSLQTTIRRFKMNGNRKEMRVFHSIVEFEKEYFPKSFEQKMEEKPTDARALGSNLAKESLDKIRTRLAK